MNKVTEIFKSWVIAENPTREQMELAAKRHAICLDCKWIRNSLLFNTKCGECGCPIGKKIFTPVKGGCRMGYWDGVDGVDNTPKVKSNKLI
jgi:hypothetical protein